ncbi:twin-arginine translocation pathway signal [bacterium 336/3]|nr:twin-arginine translocation pathway signal [bacterium 336/3]
MKRREFLKQSTLATVGTWLIPSFLKAFEEQNINFAGKRLIIIQLSGGNDGLNTIVPFENDIYYNTRPRLAIPKENVLKLNSEQGLHPIMSKMKQLYDEGLLCIFNSVGYPNPDRSHFRSMDIWHTASDSNEYLSSGWIGRFLDANCEKNCKAFSAIELDDTLSLAMKGEKVKGLALQNPEKFYKMAKNKKINSSQNHHHEHENVAYLYKTLSETVSSAEYIYEKNKIQKTSVDYPQNEFGQRLKTISQMIKSGLEIEVYYASLSGFDTHVNQLNTQERLLGIYSDAIYSLVTDLKQSGNLDNTLILTFSEFGRRVAQNASGGTDHGTANNLFIIGNSLKKKGFYNSSPKLESLDEGDLKYEIDFRSIYATILKNHLNVPINSILGKNVEQLYFL